MNLPSKTDAGMPPSAHAINQLIEEARAGAIGTGSSLLGQRRGGGALLLSRPRGLFPAERRGLLLAHPFQVTDASTNAGAAVRVRFGQVNSVTPTIDDGGDTPLDTSPAPVLSVISGVVYLEVLLDEDGLVTSAEVLNAATLPDPVEYSESTPGKAYVTLATVTVADDAVTAINQSVTHSLGFQKCGEGVYNFWGL
jgi:hypothetical protein